ncbi:unnamed protein product [Arctogadus glacialis]
MLHDLAVAGGQGSIVAKANPTEKAVESEVLVLESSMFIKSMKASSLASEEETWMPECLLAQEPSALG